MMMEFKREKTIWESIGRNTGYYFAFTLFTIIFSFISGKAGLHQIKPATYIPLIVILFITSTIISNIISIKRK